MRSKLKRYATATFVPRTAIDGLLVSLGVPAGTAEPGIVDVVHVTNSGNWPAAERANCIAN